MMATLRIMSATCFARWYQKQVPSNLVGGINDNGDAADIIIDIDIGEPGFNFLLGAVRLSCQPSVFAWY